MRGGRAETMDFDLVARDRRGILMPGWWDIVIKLDGVGLRETGWDAEVQGRQNVTGSLRKRRRKDEGESTAQFEGDGWR